MAKNKINPEEVLGKFYELFIEDDEKENDEELEEYYAKAFELINNWKREQLYKEGEDFNRNFKKFMDSLKNEFDISEPKDKVIEFLKKKLSKDYNLEPAFYRKLESEKQTKDESTDIETIIYSLWKQTVEEEDK